MTLSIHAVYTPSIQKGVFGYFFIFLIITVICKPFVLSRARAYARLLATCACVVRFWVISAFSKVAKRSPSRARVCARVPYT